VNNIGDSWAEIKEFTMNGCWMRLCPDLEQDFKGFVETPEGKAIPLQAWTGPEGSRRLRLPDFETISTLRW
jgi:hypothetical protein